MNIINKHIDDLVSIITPAYRAGNVIIDTIKSVLSQTYYNWELLIADDCSPDDTQDVVRKWIMQDERIKLISLNKNKGPASARNAALQRAKGRWVAFLDSDDVWLPKKLEIQIDFHKKSGAKITYTEFRRISSDGTKVGRRIKIPERLYYSDLLGNTAIVTSTALVDRQLTGDFYMVDTYYDDFACWLSLLKSGGYAQGLREDLLRYRVLGKSVSRNKFKSAIHVWRTYRTIEKLDCRTSVRYFIKYCYNASNKYFMF